MISGRSFRLASLITAEYRSSYSVSTRPSIFRFRFLVAATRFHPQCPVLALSLARLVGLQGSATRKGDRQKVRWGCGKRTPQTDESRGGWVGVHWLVVVFRWQVSRQACADLIRTARPQQQDLIGRVVS